MLSTQMPPEYGLHDGSAMGRVTLGERLTITVAVSASSPVAAITPASPYLTGFTTPRESTVATPRSDEDHVGRSSRTTAPY